MAIADEVGRLQPMRPEPVPGCRTECTRYIGVATKRGMWAMHAETEELIDQAYSKAPIVRGTPPISPSAALVSTDIKEAGLWLWQGEAPPPPALPRPKSRDQQFVRRIMPAAGWAGWIAVPAGLALAFLAVSMIPRPDRPVSLDTPGVALSSAPSSHRCEPDRRRTPGRAHEGSIGSGASPVGAGR
jgi:hypothetical protein